MIEAKQTAEDWRGMLWALAFCWNAADGPTREQSHDRIDTLLALDRPGTLPEVVKDCANALGIAKRRYLLWKTETVAVGRKKPQTMFFAEIQGRGQDPAYYVCVSQGPKGTWQARMGDGRYGILHLSGHDSQQEVTDHIEFLLGSARFVSVPS